ncbi:MAG: chorismate-binding protein [Actinomycetota bacterium]|nr:chorismate-binding protein [Actinomycetota bacterium]
MAESSTSDLPTYAYVAGQLATRLVDITSDPAALDTTGFWVVVLTFEGSLSCLRFADVRPAALPAGRPWQPATGGWSSSLRHDEYLSAVEQIRAAIADGEVYQVNLCRRLATPMPADTDLTGLAARLQSGNPAPHFTVVQAAGIGVVSASPERFLSREGALLTTQPIKGTAATAEAMLDKDVAENVMIVDMARNDLSRVADTGSVEVTALCRPEEHPGLVHLVSTVQARLRPGVRWAEILDLLTPAASISGAPKDAALQYIGKLEPVPRETYCGLVGWVDASIGRADLAVAIRTFWRSEGELRFGTGAGITWASDPEGEWQETELKARNLIGLA